MVITDKLETPPTNLPTTYSGLTNWLPFFVVQIKILKEGKMVDTHLDTFNHTAYPSWTMSMGEVQGGKPWVEDYGDDQLPSELQDSTKVLKGKMMPMGQLNSFDPRHKHGVTKVTKGEGELADVSTKGSSSVVPTPTCAHLRSICSCHCYNGPARQDILPQLRAMEGQDLEGLQALGLLPQVPSGDEDETIEEPTTSALSAAGSGTIPLPPQSPPQVRNQWKKKSRCGRATILKSSNGVPYSKSSHPSIRRTHPNSSGIIDASYAER
eukprot:4675772-Amphidinium_carterae.4